MLTIHGEPLFQYLEYERFKVLFWRLSAADCEAIGQALAVYL